MIEQVDNSSGNRNTSHQEKTADHMTGNTVAVVWGTAVYVALDARIIADRNVGCWAGSRATFDITVISCTDVGAGFNARLRT